MRIRQYVYFAVFSEQMPASEMTDRLGIGPDEVKVRAAKMALPPKPVAHAWEVVCRDAGLTVDEQIANVVARLMPAVEAIGQLTRIATVGGRACRCAAAGCPLLQRRPG